MRRDEDAEALFLRGFEESLDVLDGVVFLDTFADQTPRDALLTQDIVLRVDDDQRGVALLDFHGASPKTGSEILPIAESRLPGKHLKWLRERGRLESPPLRSTVVTLSIFPPFYFYGA